MAHSHLFREVRSRGGAALIAVGTLTVAGLAVVPAQAVAAPTASRATTAQVWGVDTTEAITTSNIASVKSQAGAVPKVWGRYVSDCLPGGCGGNLTPAEVSTAKSNGIEVMLISADLGASQDTGSSNGTADGKQAVSDAQANANAPTGTLIVKDIEDTTDSSFLGAWFTAVKSAGYLPGFYLNPTHSDVDAAFCGAQQTSGFSGAIVDSYEPEPGGGTLGPSGAPPLSNADHFSCSGGVYDVYQYAQSQNIGSTGFDEDVYAADTPGLLNASVAASGTETSPAIALARTGGNPYVAFHANGDKLWTWTGAVNTAGNGIATNGAVAAGTSPSIAVLPNGNLVVAFHHSGDNLLTLWTGAPNTAGTVTATYDGMAAGTSPSIAVLPNGNPVVAFHASGTDLLWTWTGAVNTPGNGIATYDGMAAGTSPSIAVLPNGNPVVAFHANASNVLWTWTGAVNTPGNGIATYDGMAAGTSPSIAVLPNGNPVVAFHANASNVLWTWTGAVNTPGNGTATYDGMAAGTSPSIAVLPNGNPVVAFHASGSNLLWTWTGAVNTPGNGTATYDGMA